MPKRTLWTTVGYGAGVASSFYLQRKLRKTVDRYAPPEVRHTVTAASGKAVHVGVKAATVVASAGTGVVGAASRLVHDVRAAGVEGRQAMRSTEADLREEYRPRTQSVQR
jgi:hypothetical protein